MYFQFGKFGPYGVCTGPRFQKHTKWHLLQCLQPFLVADRFSKMKCFSKDDRMAALLTLTLRQHERFDSEVDSNIIIMLTM